MFLESAQDDDEDDLVPATFSDADLNKNGVVEREEWLELTMEHMLPNLKKPRVRIAQHLEDALMRLDE